MRENLNLSNDYDKKKDSTLCVSGSDGPVEFIQQKETLFSLFGRFSSIETKD